MRGKLLFSLGALALLGSSAFGDELEGRTADGCSYKIINGKYMTSCSASANSAVAMQAQPVARPPSGPVTSYGDVPVRRSFEASPPSLPPQQPNQNIISAPAPAPAQRIYALEQDSAYSEYDEKEDRRRERLKNKRLDETYAGLLIGASNVKAANSGSAIGFGLGIGTNIDETFGVELGYSYARQSLNLGLARRGSGEDSFSSLSGSASSTDADLSTHLFSGEVQAHLTDPLKRLRPFFGGGIAWRSATLTESTSSYRNAYGQTNGGGSLRQNAVGGIASLGSKLRITKLLGLNFALRYFFPLLRQEGNLERPNTPTAQTKLDSGDEDRTGSSQYQVLGGVQYAF